MSTDAVTAAGVRWDLSDLYTAAADPRITSDLDQASQRAHAFASRYRGTINFAGLTAAHLAAAVAELEAITELADKPVCYAHLLHAADARNPVHGALVARTEERNTEIRNQLLFFELEWVALPDAEAARLVDAPACQHYRHFLAAARRYKPHLLSEPEERILAEKANTGSRAFCRLFDDLQSSMEFEVETGDGRHILNESGVLALLSDANRPVRRAAAASLTQGLRRQHLVITATFNTIVRDHALDDRLRSYTDPMQARHLANEISAETVDALMAACEGAADIVHEYYRLKRRLLGLDELFDYDRYAPVIEERADLPWNECRGLVLAAYADFSPRTADIAERFFTRRWIDAEVREGKRGGAFSSSAVPSAHPYVLVNYTGRPRDVMTVAHELGHGVHQYLSRERGYLQCDTPLTLAETASVFGEMLVFDRLRRHEVDLRRRLGLLCQKLEESFATVFRQIALTRFEQQLHRARREEGELSAERIGELWMAANAAMYGDGVTLTDDYRTWWGYIHHFIHTPFYCYAYGFGELLVLALYERYLQDGAAFVPRYLELLAAGGSDRPDVLLSRAGMDIGAPGFWNRGLDVLRRLLDEARALADRTPVERAAAAEPR